MLVNKTGEENNTPSFKLMDLRSKLTKSNLTQTILHVADSPGRSFELSKLMSRSWCEEKNCSLSSIPQSINSVILREQFYHLDCLLELKKSKDENFPKSKIFTWALGLAWEKKEDYVLNHLGTLIYLLDQPGIDFNKLDLEEHLTHIFKDHLEQLINKLTANIDDDPRWFRTQIEKEFSIALVSSRGLINLGLISILDVVFQSLMTEESNYTQNFICSLKQLSENSALRKKLASFDRPKSNNHLGREIIRASLELPKHQELSNVDVIRTALKAFLSYPRQETASNCFAISLAISLFSNSRERCLDDFREILTYGYLKKTLEGHTVYFPALLRQPLENVFEPLIPAHSARLIQLFNQLNTPFPQKLDPGDTIEKILRDYDVKVRDKAYFLWESHTKNPLITIWGNALAAMAEGRSNGLIKTALIGSCLWVAEEGGRTIEERRRLEEILVKRIQLNYDPSVQPLDSSHEKGAFVLYDVKRPHKPVDSPEKFQEFVCKALNHSDLGLWFKESTTLFKILEVYHPDGSHTPWITRMGNDPKEVLRTYNGGDDIALPAGFRPQNAEKLFQKILTIGREFYAQNTHKKRAPSALLLPVRIVNLHTFNLLLSHPTFTRALLENDKDPLKDVKDQSIKVSQERVPLDTINEIFNYLRRNFPNKAHLIKRMSNNHSYSSLRELLVRIFPQPVIDKKIIQFMPVLTRQELGRLAIQFADTNWAQKKSGQDIHLAFCYHPGSLKLTVFEVEENGCLIKPVDTKSQIEEATWEFFAKPGDT